MDETTNNRNIRKSKLDEHLNQEFEKMVMYILASLCKSNFAFFKELDKCRELWAAIYKEAAQEKYIQTIYKQQRESKKELSDSKQLLKREQERERQKKFTAKIEPIEVIKPSKNDNVITETEEKIINNRRKL